MQSNDMAITAPPEPGDNQPKGQRPPAITPVEVAAVDELCNILARVLMRIQAEQGPNDQGESGEL